MTVGPRSAHVILARFKRDEIVTRSARDSRYSRAFSRSIRLSACPRGLSSRHRQAPISRLLAPVIIFFIDRARGMRFLEISPFARLVQCRVLVEKYETAN